MPFTHLHVHTEYSMLDGLSRISGLVQHAKDQGMDTLAITDHGGLYGAIEFYTACKEAGVKPIIGCELYVTSGSRHDRRTADKNPFHLTVLAQNNTGYRNLMQLVTKANLEGFYYKPRVDHEILERYAEGLIVLSGCPSAELSRALIDGDMKGAEELARWYKGTFPNFYLELQRHENLPFLDTLNGGVLKLAEQLDIPLVATNDLHYVRKEDARLQDVLICIQTNTNVYDEKRLKMSDESYYLKSPQEMEALFKDLPEAVTNTERIAESCGITLDFGTLHLPEYKVPDNAAADEYLGKLCWQGFDARYDDNPTPQAKERLEYELDVITKTQYANYFLVVWDIADFARKNDIVFGVRGSAASSLALYCLGVTDIDPLEYRLVFERFLNIERKEMPDIDMDFQDDRRDEAIKYVVQKYGQDHVAQIITFGTLGAKAAIRDSGRALNMPYGDVDRIARLVPTRVGMTLDAAFEASEEMQEAFHGDPTLRRLIETARGLEGVVRHASTHAAGVVISKDPLTEHVPLQRATKDNDAGVPMTQYPMEPVAKLGLLKMDFLGLINYSILSDVRILIRERHGKDIRLSDISFDDGKTYKLLASGDTTAIFQLEGSGMRRYIRELRPTSLAELAAMVALYRPGPMEHIGTYIESKHGRLEPTYPHPALRDILEETYGIIVYQDQVLHVMRTFAGYSLGEADIVRKAMGKKIASLMKQERDKFTAGAVKLGYDQALAGQVFDLIEPFAGYAFNKAHSVSYAVVAYWTAYFKANYAVEFMTCVLNAYEGNAQKTMGVVAECARLGIAVLPPDVSRSEVKFAIDTTDDGRPAIRFGLASIKNVGEAAVEGLVEARKTKGPFKDLEDFCRRAGASVGNRRVFESLVRVGALDGLADRGKLLASIDSIMHLIQREAQLRESGQSTMFDLFGQSVPTPLGDIYLFDAPEPTPMERDAWERELLGVSLSRRTLDPQFVPEGAILSKDDLEALPDNEKVLLVGIVSRVRIQVDKQQRRIAFATLELLDSSSVEVPVWSRTYAETTDLWVEGAALQIRGPVRRRNDEVSVHCDEASVYESGDEGTEERWTSRTGPRMEEWHETVAEAGYVDEQDTATGETDDREAVGAATASAHSASVASQTPVASAGHGTARTNGNGPQTNGNGHSGGSPNGGRRKLLINLTETDEPEEDTSLLRNVLQALLDYPGNDSVDLVIASKGKRWRLEMPIITTSYCPELEEHIAEILGRADALRVLGAG